MFFANVEKFTIDGTLYEIQNPWKVDMNTCKAAIVDIYNEVSAETMEATCTFETLNGWKKDFVKKLKEFDKCYAKHIKIAYPDMSAIHL